MRTLLALSLFTSITATAAPLEFTHQGRLLDSTGQALEDATDVTFTIYADLSGTDALWTETHNLDPDNGFYSAALGTLTDIDTAVFTDNSSLYLGVTVGTDPELSPRLPIVSVPYALVADTANNVNAEGSIEVGGLTVDGTEVISSDGTIDYGALANAPADTLGDTQCDSAGQVLTWDSSAWTCADNSPTVVDGATITGTVAIDALPVGTGPDDVAAGNHSHDFADLSGTAAVGQLPVGTDSSSVAAGDHSHDSAASGFTVDGLITLATNTEDCTSALAGSLRWTGSDLEVCDGTSWSGLRTGGDGSSVASPGITCNTIKGKLSSAPDGQYWIDPDGSSGEAPFQAWCDMTTDGGGWTMLLHAYDLGNFSENAFIALFSDNFWTDHSWTYNAASNQLSAALPTIEPLSEQGMIGIDAMAEQWDDIRMACNLANNNLTQSHFVQVDGYASTNGNHQLLGSTANGTKYTTEKSSNSFDIAEVWHDNEPASANGGHYLCDTTNSGSGAAQFGFCYTDFLNNDNSLTQGDSIVSLAFGLVRGNDGWSPGFTGECGDMGGGALQNTGTFGLWVR